MEEELRNPKQGSPPTPNNLPSNLLYNLYESPVSSQAYRVYLLSVPSPFLTHCLSFISGLICSLPGSDAFNLMDDPLVYKITAKFLGLIVKPLCDLAPSPAAPFHSCASHSLCSFLLQPPHSLLLLPEMPFPFYLPESPLLILQGQTPMLRQTLSLSLSSNVMASIAHPRAHAPFCVSVASDTSLFGALRVPVSLLVFPTGNETPICGRTQVTQQRTC